MKKLLSLAFLGAFALSLTSCCNSCGTDSCCAEPCCPPAPRCCQPQPKPPVCAPRCAPQYFDNNNCCY